MSFMQFCIFLIMVYIYYCSRDSLNQIKLNFYNPILDFFRNLGAENILIAVLIRKIKEIF